MTFEEYVQQWEEAAAAIEANKKHIAELVKNEMLMRKAIEAAVQTALGDKWREGVNSFPLSDGRTLKVTHSIKRNVLEDHISPTREAYNLLNDRPVNFDEILRVKYEINKKTFDELEGDAKQLISRMVEAKPAAPTVKIV